MTVGQGNTSRVKAKAQRQIAFFATQASTLQRLGPRRQQHALIVELGNTWRVKVETQRQIAFCADLGRFQLLLELHQKMHV